MKCLSELRRGWLSASLSHKCCLCDCLAALLLSWLCMQHRCMGGGIATQQLQTVPAGVQEEAEGVVRERRRGRGHQTT